MFRAMILLLAFSVFTVANVSVVSNTAYAQEEEKKEGGEPHMNQSMFMWIIHNSGLIGLFILILSMYFVATVVQQFLALRPEVVHPQGTIAHVEAALESKDFQGIYEYVKNDGSPLGRLLAVGMEELQYGLPEAREAMDRAGEAEHVNMERGISMLAVLGSLGPMIGLLGTLKGMIASFSVIARSDQMMKASEVAGGISEALLLTFEGVALSVPAIYFFAFFKNRVMHLSVTLMLRADELLRRVSIAGKARGGGGGHGGSAAPARPAAPAPRPA